MFFRSMKKRLVAALTVTSLVLAVAAQAQVSVKIYSGFQQSGGGAPFSNLVGTFNAPQVSFGTDTGYDWHPFGLGSFGAEVTGSLCIPEDGEYVFGTTSDDGSLAYLNGVLNVDNGGGHGPAFASGAPVVLSKGDIVPFKIEFFEDFGGPSGLDFLVRLPGNSDFMLVPERLFCAVPEPGALALLLGSGVTGTLFFLRRRTRR